jgi:hypothetical protein
VDTLEQRVERQRAVLRDDDLTIQDKLLRLQRPQRRDELGKVPAQRLAGLGLQVDVIPITEREAAETVPTCGSYCQSSPSDGISCTDKASIGAYVVLIGRAMEAAAPFG